MGSALGRIEGTRKDVSGAGKLELPSLLISYVRDPSAASRLFLNATSLGCIAIIAFQ